MQRLRIRFFRNSDIKYISHLDIIRLWQRAFTRANVPLAYSEGFNPHPQISLAAPLALGITSEAELMDVVLSRWVSPHHFIASVNRQLPASIGITDAQIVPPGEPSLQAQIGFSEYEAVVPSVKDEPGLEQAIGQLLALEELPWEHQRDTGPHHYDLRRLIEDIWLVKWDGEETVIGMRLRCDNSGSGRAEQVTLALGYEEIPHSIHRTRLILRPAPVKANPQPRPRKRVRC